MEREKQTQEILKEEAKEEIKIGFIVQEKSVANERHPERNDDVIFSDKERNVYAVFDGISGGSGGDVASKLSRDTLEKNAQTLKKPSVKKTKEALVKITEEANQKIRQRAEEKPELRGMGTTASIVKIFEYKNGKRKAIIGNLGDSRIYILGNSGELEQVTIDDNSLFYSYSDKSERINIQKELSNSNDPKSLASGRGLTYQRSEITKYLGLSSDVEPEICVVDINEGDKMVITSDGVHDNLTDNEMEQILKNGGEVAENLINAARNRSKEGKDKHPRSKYDDMSAIVVYC